MAQSTPHPTTTATAAAALPTHRYRGIANSSGTSCHTSSALQLLFHCFPSLQCALLELAPLSANYHVVELLQEQKRLRTLRTSVHVNRKNKKQEKKEGDAAEGCEEGGEEDIESLQIAAQKRREERRKNKKKIANNEHDKNGGNGGESKEQEQEEQEEEVVDTIEVLAKSNHTLKMQENDIQELQYAAQKRREERFQTNKQQQRASTITASMTSENDTSKIINGSEGGVNTTEIRNEFVYQLSWFFHLLAYSEDILKETKNDFCVTGRHDRYCVGDEIMSDDDDEVEDGSVKINEEEKEGGEGGENDNEVAKGALAAGAIAAGAAGVTAAAATSSQQQQSNPFEQFDKDMELEDENNIDAMMAASGMMSASNSFFDQGLSLIRNDQQPATTNNNPFDQFDHPDTTTKTTGEEEGENKQIDASSELKAYLAVDSAAHESLAEIAMTLAASRSYDEEEEGNKAIRKKSRGGKEAPSSRRHKSRSDRSHSRRHSHRSSSSRQQQHQRSSSRHSSSTRNSNRSSSRHSTKSHRLKRPKDMTPLQRAAIDAFMAKARNGQGSDDDWERLVTLMKDDDREGYEEALGMVISKQSNASGAEEVDDNGGGMLPNQIIGGEGTGRHADDDGGGSSGNNEKRSTSSDIVMGGNLGGSATLSSNPNNAIPNDAIDPTSFYQHLSSYTSSSSSQGASSHKRDSFSINTNNVGDAAMVFRCLVSALEHSVKCELERLNKILEIREIELWNEEGKDNGKGTTTAAVNNAGGSNDDDDDDDDANQQSPTTESDLQSALLQIQSSIQSSWSGTLISRIVGTCSTVSYQATAEFSYDGTNVITKPTIITTTTTTMRTKKNGIKRPIPVPWPVPVIMQSWQLAQNEQKKQGAAKPQLERRESQIPNGTKPYFKDLVQSIHSITITPNPIRGYDWRSLMKHNDGSDIVEQTFVKRVDGDGNQIPESKRGSLNDSFMSHSGHARSVENTDGGTGGTAEGSGESKENGDIVPEGLSVGPDMTQDTSPDNVYVEAALDNEDEGPSRSIACQVDFGFDRGTQTTLDEDGNLVHTGNEQILEIREYIEEPEKEANEEEVEKEVSEANATEATAEESKDEESSSGNPRASPTNESTSSNNPNAKKFAIEKDSVYTAAVFALVSTPRVRRGGSVSSRRSASSRLREQRVRREERISSDTSSAEGMNQNDNAASASSSDARVRKAYDASPGIFSSGPGYTTPFGMEVGPSSPEETTTMSYAPSPTGSPALPLGSDSSSSDSEDTSVDSRVSSVDTDTSSDEDDESSSDEDDKEDDNNVVQGLAQVQHQEAQRQHTYREIFGDDHSSMTHSSAIETPENLDELSLGSFTDDSLSDGDEKKNEEDVDIRVRKLPHPEDDGDGVVAAVGEEAPAEQDSLDGRVNEAMDRLALESFSPTRKASENEADAAIDNEQEMSLPGAGSETEGETEENPFAMPELDDNKGPLDSYVKAASVGSTSYSAVSDSDEDSSSDDSSSDNDSSTSSSSDSSDSSDSSTSTGSSSTSASSSDDSASFSSSQEEKAEEVAENSTDHDDRGDHYSATTSNYPHNETQEEWVTRKETRLVNPLPQNLIFHLKRFEYSSVLGRVEKLPGTMSVPEELDMKTFCLESLGVANESELPGQLCCYEYRLSGAIVHVDPIEEMKKDAQFYGETSEGHYVTFISSSVPSSENLAAGTVNDTADPSTIPQDKQMGSTWTEIDDEFVRNVDSNENSKDSLHPALKIINGCDVSNHDSKQTSESSNKRVVKEKERRYATLVVYSRACQCYQ